MIYVDDSFLAAPFFLMQRLLSAIIHAIFTVCGFPEPALQQCALALDKWEGMFVTYRAIFCGILYDARALTVAITLEYLNEVRRLLNTTWRNRKRFMLSELEQLWGNAPI